jgi:hypothetical protein
METKKESRLKPLPQLLKRIVRAALAAIKGTPLAGRSVLHDVLLSESDNRGLVRMHDLPVTAHLGENQGNGIIRWP